MHQTHPSFDACFEQKTVCSTRMKMAHRGSVRFTLPSIRNCTKRTGFVQFWSFQMDLGHSTLHHRRAIPQLQWIDRLTNRTLPKLAHSELTLTVASLPHDVMMSSVGWMSMA